MARNSIAKGKLARRFGINVFGNPKYDRLLTKKPLGPGKSSTSKRKKLSDYGRALLEKQKIRFGYGVSEKYMRKVFDSAVDMKGNTGFNLIYLLENRLDNIVYKLSLASTVRQARQLISHGHLLINNKKITIASYRLKKDDVISVKDKPSSKALFEGIIQDNSSRIVPPWLETDRKQFSGTVVRMPERDEMSEYGQEQLVVEFYSR